MEIAVLHVGSVDVDVVNKLQSGLCEVFPGTRCVILEEEMSVPQDAYNPMRRQYFSSRILAELPSYAERFGADRVLGVTEVDLFVLHLNFVFGEAECLGKAAIISLFRLKPEFYGQPPNDKLFAERCVKEAIHEVGHTLGLVHCGNPACIMFFSNSISDTDRKNRAFCGKCYHKAAELL